MCNNVTCIYFQYFDSIRDISIGGYCMCNNVTCIYFQYFYSIKDISIGGRCVCNGHADACSKYAERGNERKLICNCRHNTCGDQCETCCPGFVQKPWKPATPEDTNECERKSYLSISHLVCFYRSQGPYFEVLFLL